MPLEESVKRSLAEAARSVGVPPAAIHRVEVLASALADGQLDPVFGPEMERRLDIVLRGFDIDSEWN
jgi:hypothetical protein